MYSNSLYQDSSEKKVKDIVSLQRSRGKIGRPKSFPRLKFSIKLEMALLMKSVVVNSGARRAASSLSLKEVTQFRVRTQTNSYAQDVLSSSWIHQSVKSPRPRIEATKSAINSEDFYGEKHFFP